MIDDLTLRRAMKNAYNSGVTNGDQDARAAIIKYIKEDVTVSAWFTPEEIKHLISVIERAKNV